MPQLINFVYGLPQLFRFLECPRHRLPAYIVDKDVSDNSWAVVDVEQLSPLGKTIFRVYKGLRLCRVEKISPAQLPRDASRASVSALRASNQNDEGDQSRSWPSGSSWGGPPSSSPNSPKNGRDTAQLNLGGKTSVSPTNAVGGGSSSAEPGGEPDLYRISNLTLINLVLYIFGPMNERTLVIVLLLLQVFFSLSAFWVRYCLSGLLYTKVL